jgi:hypothetical protein
MLTLQELKQIEESLRECKPDVEDFSWGPSLEFAWKRKEDALKILKREIKNYNKETLVP